MKKSIKILVFILVLSVMIGIGVLGAHAEEGDDVKLKISAYVLDGSKIDISSHTELDEGWNAAMALASDKVKIDENEYIYIVVDILSDWTAEDGSFTNEDKYSAGFYNGALYVPAKAHVMINLNGHTLDRDLDDYKYNGEVLCIDRRANVILNGGADQFDGTTGKITGGFSCNGAGGIHIHDNARVSLNNISVSGNNTEDDNGAGIALYNGAYLLVSGGEISNNTTYGSTGAFIAGIFGLTTYRNYGAGVYIKDATAEFVGVTFTQNKGGYGDEDEAVDGDVIAARNSDVKMYNCDVFENSIRNENNDLFSNVFYIIDSKFSINNCDIYNNGSKLCYLFNVEDSTLTIDSSKIYGNGTDYVIIANDTEIEMHVNNIYDNEGGVMLINDEDCVGEIYNTSFNNNNTKINGKGKFAFDFSKKLDDFYFGQCDFGNSTFDNKDYAQYSSSNTASIFSGGSLTIIISIAALAVALASLFVAFIIYKRSNGKFEGVSKNNTTEAKSEE